MGQYLKALSLLLIFAVTLSSAYVFPAYEIEVYNPKGFKVSIPDSEGVTLFAVHININKELEYLEAGQIARDVVKRRGDRWVYEDKNLRLRAGDKLYFWLYVIVDGLGYRLDNQEYIVENLLPSQSTPTVGIPKPTNPPRIDSVTDSSVSQPSCKPGYTTVSGKEVCKGDIIFFEQFQNTVGWGSSNNWTSEVQVPRTAESYFVVMDKTNRQVENGFLVMEPSLLEEKYNDNFIRNGYLRLIGCTAESRTKCESNGFSWNIIPPVLTSRINTKNSFNFKYGLVEIRAKLPKGDWIVPEIWLVGKNYGPNSGRILLAKSFGNDDLKLNGKNIGGQLLYQGVSTNETDTILYSRASDKLWSDSFHIFKIEWTPGYIKFMVDQTEIAKLEPKEKLFKEIGGSYLAPFDTEFYLSIGVHVGGLVDFPDNAVNRGKPKPWLNEELRNVLKFWLSKDKWHQTWGDHSRLLVDYIKVIAL